MDPFAFVTRCRRQIQSPFKTMKTIARVLWIVAAAFVCARGSAASPAPAALFAGQPQSLAPVAGRGVALADFNGDGRLDAFVVADNTSESQGHRVFVGDGHGGLADSGQVLAHYSAFAHRPAAGDIDADGDVDVVVSRTVWLNDGRGEFASQDDRIERAEPEIAVVKLADLDGDGSLDLFAIHGSNTIRIHLNDGKGRFRERSGQLDHGVSAGSSSIGDVALADVDGNGSIDAVTAGWRDRASDVCPNRVWLNDGHGGFRDSGQILDEADRHVHGVAIGDFDGDNLPDIVLALITPGEAGKIYFNTGQGRFRESGQKLGDQWAHGVAPGDLDCDGDLDVFLVCGDPKNGTPNQVWLNDGQGRFIDSGLRLGNAYSRGAALGDLDGDGHLDAFVANLRLADASKIPWVFGGATPEVWLNTTRCTECADVGRDDPEAAVRN